MSADFGPRMRVLGILAVAISACALAAPAHSAGDPNVAALQVGLRGQGLYRGTVDGVLGPATQEAVRRLQLKKGLAADGIPGPKTRSALGKFGRHAPLGRRTLQVGARGWDVAALQFSLAWHGFPSGPMDGHFGGRTKAALLKFQAWAGITPTGTAGPATLAGLRRPVPTSPIGLAAPVAGPTGDVYGPRGNRFHSGVDFPAATGTPVSAAATGTVVTAGRIGGGWGKVVVIEHSRGVRTMYAHLSRIAVRPGQLVTTGARIGRVGATGRVTGPHLHFEAFVRGANVDPQSGF